MDVGLFWTTPALDPVVAASRAMIDDPEPGGACHLDAKMDHCGGAVGFVAMCVGVFWFLALWSIAKATKRFEWFA